MSLLKSNGFISLLLRLTSLTAGALIILIFAFLVRESWPAFQLGFFKFFTDGTWNPGDGDFNMVPMIIGSLAVAMGAIVIAVPAGVGTAIYMDFYASPWGKRFMRSTIELLAGVPSVIFGFWGLTVIVPLLYQLSPPGANLLGGALVLAVMVVPTVAIFISNGVQSLPASWLIGAEALGLSTASTITKLVLPSIRGSIVSGILISLGRALGETMAVLMVCGNIIKVPTSIFDPIRTLTANIALEMAYALDQHRSALFLSGLLLLLMVFALMAVAQHRALRDSYAP
ncbi:phosphate ABC transporter permease subunit PstC [Pseudobacteriovorax antillogorgiicola]|uniref:Phosphate transport system permease protein n=1 Tax=Pseudobacteriovorax antillogorgiicola TaxID=1513793 RepID=A0A1Y6CJP1_9BACT|nr:phosphate ABC transporter permease subunit PstC [Pseudobacteriovorax antillogorgiicola]TCS46701.1 phosphate ABC transporter membrane protein 1 (PhoT family) [Pseudobacteriovorax antillogorgiicola]SMF66893.1 phosphate ABC transporter membrane protein 1, PhoT family [Pseudobacteriovorax antillogorgiicola]